MAEGSEESRIREFFLDIEEAFCRHRGAPLLLSTLDFEKAVEWYAAGIPADVVRRGIARYFEKLEVRKTPRRRAICLSFAEEEILKAREEARVAAVGRAAGVRQDAVSPAERIQVFLDSRIGAVRRFLDDAERASAHAVLSRYLEGVLGELGKLQARAGEPLSKLEGILEPIDAEVGRLVLLESPPEEVECWRGESRRRLRPMADAMEPEIFEKTVAKFTRQRALEARGLPRFSLLFLED